MIKLAKPYFGEMQALTSALRQILASGQLTQGKFVDRFEKRMQEYLGIKHAIAVSSGTAALHLSLMALGIGPGDDVIVPAYTFPATANVVEQLGARPVLVEVSLETYNILVDKIGDLLSQRTKAIIPVHLFGNPVDMNPLLEIAKKHKLAVVEDAAGAMGAEYKKKKCGTMGTIGCFSFHPRKIITTGEGGLVATNDTQLAEQIRNLRNHGFTRNKRDFTCPGLNYRMNEMEAALGLNQIAEIEQIIAERQRKAEDYVNLLSKVSTPTQKVLPEATSVWQAFVILLQEMTAPSAIKRLADKGIESSIGTYAIHLLNFYRNKYNYRPSYYPNATQLYLNAVALPFYNGMSAQQMKHVTSVIRNFLPKLQQKNINSIGPRQRSLI